MRRWLKWIGIAALVPVSLVSLLAVLLYIPSFQDFAVREAAAYASRATGMRIGIQRLRLSFPLALSVRGIEVVGASADTLLSLGDLTVRVQARPLFRRQVLVEAVDLRDVRLDTGSSLEGMTIRGTLGRLYAKADYIDLATERATLNEIDLSDTAITLLLDDTSARADTRQLGAPAGEDTLTRRGVRAADALRFPATDRLHRAGGAGAGACRFGRGII